MNFDMPHKLQINIDPKIAKAKFSQLIENLMHSNDFEIPDIGDFSWVDAAKSVKQHNRKVLTDCGFVRDADKRWIPSEEWKSVDAMPPQGVPLMVFRQAYGIGNPLHPGFGTDAWIEESSYLEHPWRGFACTLVSSGFATHWMRMPATASKQSIQTEKQWKHINIIGVQIGPDHYCQWSEILKSPVSPVMEIDDFQNYVVEECGFSPDVINELPAWIQYVQAHGVSDKSLGNVVAKNGAGFEGAHLSIQKLIEEYATK